MLTLRARFTSFHTRLSSYLPYAGFHHIIIIIIKLDSAELGR